MRFDCYEDECSMYVVVVVELMMCDLGDGWLWTFLSPKKVGITMRCCAEIWTVKL